MEALKLFVTGLLPSIFCYFFLERKKKKQNKKSIARVAVVTFSLPNDGVPTKRENVLKLL